MKYRTNVDKFLMFPGSLYDATNRPFAVVLLFGVVQTLAGCVFLSIPHVQSYLKKSHQQSQDIADMKT